MIRLDNIKDNLKEIRDDIKNHSENPEIVKMVVASKYVDYKGIEALVDAGQIIAGENRVQAMEEKRENLSTEYNNKIDWHFIGTLQKNKVKYIIDYVNLIHAVDKLSLLKQIDKLAGNQNIKQKVLLEVNISGEESKHGFKRDEIIENIEEILAYKNVEIIGLMTMAPFVDNEEIVRNVFKELRLFKDKLNNSYFHGKLTELSMGMSGDYKIALEEGSTIIRIGSKVFS